MQVSSPIGPVEFDRLMRAVGPFESAPHIAVAVSGGGDSMALCLLLAPWVAARGGRLLALTVDHGLRADSTAEAGQVAAWLAARSIDHRILSWIGTKPRTGVQAGARHARLSLLAAAAASDGILHLALAHHADDQAETHRLRADRSSGPEGMAGMPAIREMDELRLLRPLLAIPKARLQATCRAGGQEWIEDPSNHSLAFARGRIRADGLAGPVEATAALAAGRQRAAREERLSGLLADGVRFQREGWALVSADLWTAAGEDGLAVLSTLLRAVGGAPYPPAPAATAEMLAALIRAPLTGRTLAGCQFTPVAGGWRLTRESRNLPSLRVGDADDRTMSWDGRFRLSISASGAFEVMALDDDLWRQALAACPDLAATEWPATVRRAVPAILREGRLWGIPHLAYRVDGAADPGMHIVPLVSVPAVPARFAVVTAADDII